MGADDLRGKALVALVMVDFILDALRYFLKFLKEYRNKEFYWMDLLAAKGNISMDKAFERLAVFSRVFISYVRL